MNFPKKLGRTSVDAKPPVVDEKSEGSEKSEDREEKLIQDNFFGTIQKIRHDYDEHLQIDATDSLPIGITPSLPNETPELRLPPYTTIIIQEDRADAGGVADIYRGTISSVGHDADLIEQTGPMWLGDLLLRVCNYTWTACLFKLRYCRIKFPSKTYRRCHSFSCRSRIFCPVSQVPMGESDSVCR